MNARTSHLMRRLHIGPFRRSLRRLEALGLRDSVAVGMQICPSSSKRIISAMHEKLGCGETWAHP
jgi:hypothetical protein